MLVDSGNAASSRNGPENHSRWMRARAGMIGGRRRGHTRQPKRLSPSTCSTVGRLPARSRLRSSSLFVSSRRVKPRSRRIFSFGPTKTSHGISALPQGMLLAFPRQVFNPTKLVVTGYQGMNHLEQSPYIRFDLLVGAVHS